LLTRLLILLTPRAVPPAFPLFASARRASVCGLHAADFDRAVPRLRIHLKGRGTQTEWITLPRRAGLALALNAYLQASGLGDDPDFPLFLTAASRESVRGHGLMMDGLYHVVRTYGKRLGVRLSPHRLRHTLISVALDLGADLPSVAKLSMHQDVLAVVRYDDARRDLGGEVSRRIADAL
jgi:integrase/recombinase XerC